MQTEPFDRLRAEVRATRAVRDVGRVTDVARSVITVSGLLNVAALGDQVRWISRNWTTLAGEIVRIGTDGAQVMMAGPADGIRVGDRVQHLGPCEIAPDEKWLGRTVDPLGRPLDGKPLLRGVQPRRLYSAPPPAAERRGLGPRLETGLRIFNTILPIASGQRIGLFAGSGVGKSRLLSQLATGMDADVVVVGLVGERGRELREFVEQVLGPSRMERTVVVAATADQSPLARRRCMWSAMTVAEHFRDQGRSVLLLADSITRFAEAHREVAIAAGESNAMRGYPASVAQMIMGLAERAGTGTPDTGDITAVFSVLVAGSDFEEPVSDILRGVLDGHIVLDRAISERGRFPPINVLKSISRSLPDVATSSENAKIARARALLGTHERVALMVQSGLYTPGTDAEVDAAVRAWPLLDEFVTEVEDTSIERSFERLAECLAAAGRPISGP